MLASPGAMPWILTLYTLSFPLLLAVAVWGLARQTARYRSLKQKFRGIVDTEKEIERLLGVASADLGALNKSATSLRDEVGALQSAYKQKKTVFDDLVRKIAVFDERYAFAEMGVYEPHFDFDDSDEYKRNIEQVREEQKALVSNKEAALATKEWTVDGSRAKGETMAGRGVRLTLRAFNGECDAAVANVRWNNANAMEQRILRAQEQIDKLNESNAIVLSGRYVELKLKELRLTHEYREKLKEEKEQRTEAARVAREEQKLQRDLETAQEEEERYAKLLAKAKLEAATISGAKLGAFADQIRILERDLAEAHSRVARAQAMAERTRSGYVYIVSNVGSFGEDVVKIGLTRRLDPADRVKELGDASVPFFFDTHAIIYSDDAPALEHALHQEFESSRVNTSNYRKEFFRTSIAAVESAVARLAPDAAFFSDIEAQEYRETLARRQVALQSPASADIVPETI